jgi:hypothetical protein
LETASPVDDKYKWLTTTTKVEKGSLLFYTNAPLIQDHLIQSEIRDSLAKPDILFLQVLKTLGLVRLQTTILFALAVIALFGYAKGFADQPQLLALGKPHFSLPDHPK